MYPGKTNEVTLTKYENTDCEHSVSTRDSSRNRIDVVVIAVGKVQASDKVPLLLFPLDVGQACKERRLEFKELPHLGLARVRTYPEVLKVLQSDYEEYRTCTKLKLEGIR